MVLLMTVNVFLASQVWGEGTSFLTNQVFHDFYCNQHTLTIHVPANMLKASPGRMRKLEYVLIVSYMAIHVRVSSIAHHPYCWPVVVEALYLSDGLQAVQRRHMSSQLHLSIGTKSTGVTAYR